MLDKTTFQNWLSDFFNTKSNELEYSRVSQPKRMEKITLNLATASGDPFQINVPFRTMIVSRIYSTAVTTTDKAGTIKIMFDQDNISNIKNAISLFPNDTLRSGTLVTKAFLSWDAQSDTSVDLYFYPDIEVIAGTTKTQIVGSVTIQNTSTTGIYNKIPFPDSATDYSVTGSNSASYTVAAGKTARVTYGATAVPGGGTASALFIVGGVTMQYTECLNAGTPNSVCLPGLIFPAGTVLLIQTTSAGAYAYMHVELYS